MNLFYASTTYHVLLCYMIALSDCDGEDNVLLLIGNLAANNTHTLFQALFPSAFSKEILLESYPDHNNFKRIFAKKSNLKKIKEIVCSLKNLSKFYYVCDWKVEVAYISYLLRNMDVEFHYYEDGMGTYIGNYRQSNLFARAFAKIYYGTWRIAPKAEGLLNAKSHIHAMFPELLPTVYEGNEKHKIDAEKVTAKLKLENFPKELAEYAKYPIEIFLALPTVDEINSAFISMMRQQIDEADRHDHAVAIKKHPRTKTDDPIARQLNINGKLIDLPKDYPAEIYYLLLGKTLKRVIGFTSTAMMTAKMLLPCAEVAVLYTQKSVVADKTAPRVFELFRKMEIELKELSD